MRVLSFLVVLCYFSKTSSSGIDVGELKCLVCQTGIKELQKLVDKIDPSKTVVVGNGRLDDKGNYKQKKVSQAKSELHLSELIDDLCNVMDDYVRATWKSNGTLTLLKFIESGQMNSAMSEVDIIQDEDLNKSLKYNCESIVEVYEEEIIKEFLKDSDKNIVNRICNSITNICSVSPDQSRSEL